MQHIAPQGINMTKLKIKSCKLIVFFLFILLPILCYSYPEQKIIIYKIEDEKYSEVITKSNEPIRFNFVRLGDIKSKTIYIENAGTSTYHIQNITFINKGLGVFSYSSTPNVPVNILPSEAIFITLNFQPDKIDKFYDTLLIKFTEPFDFIFPIPIEGSSIAYNLLFAKDTSEFVGTNNFTVPIFLKGDPEITEGIPLSFVLSLCVNSKVFLVDKVSSGIIVENNFVQTSNTLKILIDNIVLDSSTKVVTNLIGKLLLSDQDTTILTLDSIELDIPGVYLQTKNAVISLLAICASNISLIDFDRSLINFSIPEVINLGILKIQCDYIFYEKTLLDVKIFDILGNLVYFNRISLEPEIEIPLNNLSSGTYRVEVTYKSSKYSKIISVLK